MTILRLLLSGKHVTYTAWKMFIFGVVLVHIFPYSVWMRQNTDQKNSEYGHFSSALLFTFFPIQDQKDLKKIRLTQIIRKKGTSTWNCQSKYIEKVKFDSELAKKNHYVQASLINLYYLFCLVCQRYKDLKRTKSYNGLLIFWKRR